MKPVRGLPAEVVDELTLSVERPGWMGPTVTRNPAALPSTSTHSRGASRGCCATCSPTPPKLTRPMRQHGPCSAMHKPAVRGWPHVSTLPPENQIAVKLKDALTAFDEAVEALKHADRIAEKSAADANERAKHKKRVLTEDEQASSLRWDSHPVKAPADYRGNRHPGRRPHPVPRAARVVTCATRRHRLYISGRRQRTGSRAYAPNAVMRAAATAKTSAEITTIASVIGAAIDSGRAD